MAPRNKAAKAADAGSPAGSIQSEKLEPIRVVKRTLTRPDGTTLEVEVPVYPPFRLPEGGSPRRPAARPRNVPRVKRKREGGKRS